jgi:hypothetical protein
MVDPGTAGSIGLKAAPLVGKKAKEFLEGPPVKRLIRDLKSALPKESRLAPDHDKRVFVTEAIFGNGAFRDMFDPKSGMTTDPEFRGLLAHYLQHGAPEVLPVLRERVVALLELTPRVKDPDVDLAVVGEVLVEQIERHAYRALKQDRDASHFEHGVTRATVTDAGVQVEATVSEWGAHLAAGQAEILEHLQSLQATKTDERAEASAAPPVYRYLSTTWAPQAFQEDLDALIKRAPEQYDQLQELLRDADPRPSSLGSSPLHPPGLTPVAGSCGGYSRDTPRRPACGRPPRRRGRKRPPAPPAMTRWR